MKAIKKILALVLLPFAGLFGLFGSAGAAESSPSRTLSVVGEGRVEVKPDRAVVSAALLAQSGSGREAKARLEAVMSEVIEKLTGLGVQREDIRAESLRLRPEYENFLFSGYGARRDLSVTLKDLDDIGRVTDMLAQYRQARIHGVSYGSSREDEARQEALRRAVADSREQAARIAKHYGMELGKPVSVAHSSRRGGVPFGLRGVPQMSALESAPADAPYLADDLIFEETVEVVFEMR